MDETAIQAALDEQGVLNLCDRDLDDAALCRWERFGWLDQVRVLDLSGNSLTDAGLARLIECKQLRGLEELDLSQNDLGERAGMLLAEEVELLLRSSGLPKLRTLVLLPPRIWGAAGEVDVVISRREIAGDA